jgi:hypothetical protein
MSFVSIANPPSSTAEPVVSNDGWFPDMDPKAVRAACRLDGTVTADRMAPALQAAMLHVNAELEQYQAEQRTRWGYETLADVPAPHMGGVSAQVLRYCRAVHACLQADLAEAYRDLDTMPAGMGKEARVLSGFAIKVDEHRRNQRWAISDLLGIARSTVELI